MIDQIFQKIAAIYGYFQNTLKTKENNENKNEDKLENYPFSFPQEIMLHIILYLSRKDLVTFARSCKAANTLSQDNMLWQNFALKEGWLHQYYNVDLSIKEKCKVLSETIATLREQYNPELVDKFGGAAKLACLPILNGSCPEWKELKDLKGHKIMRSEAIKGKEKGGYIAFCLKKPSSSEEVLLNVCVIHSNSVEQSGYFFMYENTYVKNTHPFNAPFNKISRSSGYDAMLMRNCVKLMHNEFCLPEEKLKIEENQYTLTDQMEFNVATHGSSPTL